MKPTFKQVTKTRYVQLVSELAKEIFVQHYTKLTPKVAAALADKYQSDVLTDDEIHSGVINYFLIYLGSEPVGYFAMDLGPAGALCLSRLFLKEKARGQGIGRSVGGLRPETGGRGRPGPPVHAGVGPGPESRDVLQEMPFPQGGDGTRGGAARRDAGHHHLGETLEMTR